MKKKTPNTRKDVRDLLLKVKAEMAFKEAVAEALAEHKRQDMITKGISEKVGSAIVSPKGPQRGQRGHAGKDIEK